MYRNLFHGKKLEYQNFARRFFLNRIILATSALALSINKSLGDTKVPSKKINLSSDEKLTEITQEASNASNLNSANLNATQQAYLRNLLSSPAGSSFIGRPKNIIELKTITPLPGLIIKIGGYNVINDGGEGDWFFDNNDLSSAVSLYPDIFITPNIDQTGKSGAWRISHQFQIETWRYGVGKYKDNKKIIEEIDRYNISLGYEILFPRGNIFCSSLRLSSNKFRGMLSAVASENGGIGTTFIFINDNEQSDCITIQRDSGRLTGLQLSDISVISNDFYSKGKTKTKRRPWNLSKIGGQVDIKNIFTAGFALSAVFDEVWDGSVYGWRMLYCGSDNESPALWLGSTGHDNTNALHFWGLHIEHSPYMLHCDFVRHVQIHASKFETGDSGMMSSPAITFSKKSQEINFVSVQFITNPISNAFFIEDNGTQSSYIGCWFNAGAIGNDKYPGIRWFNGLHGENHKIVDSRFTGCLAVGDNEEYPITLGDYDIVSSCTIVTNSKDKSGIYNVGTGCILNNINSMTSSNKNSGSVYFFRGHGSDIINYMVDGGKYFSLVSGNRYNNLRNGNSNIVFLKNANELNTEGATLVFIDDFTDTQNITSITGLAGQSISISSQTGKPHLINGPRLALRNNKDVTVPVNAIITLQCVSSDNKFIELTRTF